MELVYFVYPVCDANCAHCWSHNIMMGRKISIEEHYRIIDEIDIKMYSMVKISGGEPFLYDDLHNIISYMRRRWGENIPIVIFTSGRQLLSLDKAELERNIQRKLGVYKNISLQLSVDEFHVEVLNYKYKWVALTKDRMHIIISNFIDSCSYIKDEVDKTFDFKLKMHCGKGRVDYHVHDLYDWIPNEWWNKYIILTEGLVKSGNAKKMEDAFEITESNLISHFLFPGVSFGNKPRTRNAIEFKDKNNMPVFLDDDNKKATVIIGWWNVINKYADFYSISI